MTIECEFCNRTFEDMQDVEANCGSIACPQLEHYIPEDDDNYDELDFEDGC